MELTELRKQIDRVDEEIVRLFKQRMFLASQVAQYKKENHLPIYVPEREKEKLDTLRSRVMPEMEGYLEELYETLFSLSRRYQEEQL